MNYKITLMGTIGGISYYTRRQIERILQQKSEAEPALLDTARETTYTILEAQTVLKLYPQSFNLAEGQKWTRQILEKQRFYQIHHPYKTWFVAHQETDEQTLIGHISPRLQPLQTCFIGQGDSQQRLNYLQQIFQQTFHLAKAFDVQPAQTLGYFAHSEDNNVYYLADDFYPWDNFQQSGQFISHCFIAFPWLNEQTAQTFGINLRKLILHYFPQVDSLPTLINTIENEIPAVTRQKPALITFLDILAEPLSPKKNHPCLRTQRYLAILADIHANLPALNTVLTFLKRQNISQGFILGDIVGYGPHPSQCIEKIQNSQFTVLKGNHDNVLATNDFNQPLSASAAWVLRWSRQHIDEQQRQWLAALPSVLQDEHWLALHGAPIDPQFFNEYVHDMTYQSNLDVLQSKHIPLCFHGHTHQPGVYGRIAMYDKFYLQDKVDVNQLDYALICPGSVGQPRNGQTGCQFAIYDQQTGKIYYHRLLYDIEKTATLMQAEQFPATLINLLRGKFRKFPDISDI